MPSAPIDSWLALVSDVGADTGGDGTRRFRGGRGAALERLEAIDPPRYAATRNHVDGAVTSLSPWIRHGVLGLAEVRDAALARVTRADDALVLVRELAWRDYWLRVQGALGARIGRAIEAPAAVPRRQPATRLPDDVRDAATGLACIDDFSRRLRGDGWLHNHERMWLASWLVHVRGIDWRAGADWFLSHLLDGDPASNHLSWQWVAGTFAAKPYLFNRENLESFTAGRHCRGCPVAGVCDLEGSYEDLAGRLFDGAPTQRPALRIPPGGPWRPALPTAPRRPLVWVTLDAAAETAPAPRRYPDSPRLFIIDPEWLAAERPSPARLRFLFECLADIGSIDVVRGDPTVEVPRHARAHGCDGVALTDTPCPRLRRQAGAIAAVLPVEVVDRPQLVDAAGVRDLGRFSRYWQQVSASALRPTARG